jgi:ribosomal protein S18 acetylase RimI-like enzyme
MIIRLRKAVLRDAQKIHELLSAAFEPYRQYYTEEAYNATVLSPQRIERRIHDRRRETWILLSNERCAGTVSLKLDEKRVYIQSMAVAPAHQGRGIGKSILEEIEKRGRELQCKELVLESFAPLTKAVTLYERYGFKSTGEKRQYYGIVIFEMVKKL